MKHTLVSSLIARLVPALALSVILPFGTAAARAAAVEPRAVASGETSVAVDTSEIPDFDPALARQLGVEATAKAREFGFEPGQITITIVWLDAASSSYGVHVHIETDEAELPDGPRGPLLGRCEQCSHKRVPAASLEALDSGFDLYEHTRETQRRPNPQVEAPVVGEQERHDETRVVADQAVRTREQRRLKRQRAGAAVSLAVGGAVHVLGITMMILWKDGYSTGLDLRGRQYYVPGTVLLAISPAPIAAGAVLLADHAKAKKKLRATASLVGLPRGLGLGTTIRF